MRMVLVVLALGVTGCGVGSNQTPLPPVITVSPDALAEYQQSLYDVGFGGEVIPEKVRRAESFCNNLYLESNDGLIESALIGEHERRFDAEIKVFRALLQETIEDGGPEPLIVSEPKYWGPIKVGVRMSEYDDLRLTVLYACPEFARFISVLSPD